MAETFLLEVATPERRLVAEQAAEAQIPAANGYVGVLPGHAALLAELAQVCAFWGPRLNNPLKPHGRISVLQVL